MPDEVSTIEEQELMEGESDHKSELVDLAKNGTYSLILTFCAYVEKQDRGGYIFFSHPDVMQFTIDALKGRELCV